MNNLPATLQASIQAMDSVTKSIDTQSGDFAYLKLTKAGEWCYGSSDDEIQDGSVFAVGTDTFFAGFQAWDEGELMGEEIRLLTEPPVTKADLEDVGAEWKPLIGFQLVCVSGDDKGLQLVYKTTAKGGIKEVNSLMKAIVAQVKAGGDGFTPLIKLETDSYKHKKYGKIYTPYFEVTGWTDEVNLSDDKTDTVDDQTDTVDDQTDTVDDQTDAQPARRRRRRA